ncbi:DNA-binding MarR family transcriptional regulator [Promicromonospora sp. AC04]|nr:DNA-binding MarR family transcriptional regulator [Promicromonospora sp. AC04]
MEAWRLSQMLVTLAERAKADFASTVAPLGLPMHLARALAMLDEPAPMSELAERLECDRSYITSLADQLEERGLAGRVPGTDRRVKLLALTNEGRELRDKIAAAVSAGSMMLTRLDDEQRASLAPLLERLLGDELVVL